MKIIIKDYILKNKKVNNKNIVLLSDIHYYNKKDFKKLNFVLEEIELLKPDYICIVGDTFDEAIVYQEDIIIDWLKKLSKISKVIMSIGNHDMQLTRPRREYINKKLFNKINKIYNLYLLNNEIFIDNNINFIGITNSFEYYNNKEKCKTFINELNKINLNLYNDNYNIMLCHSPISVTKQEVIENCNTLKKIDLVLCGHMHGGIVPEVLRPIFKNRGFISPHIRLFIKDAYGYIKKKNIIFIISSGITKASHANPFKSLNTFFKSEIVNIKIK